MLSRASTAPPREDGVMCFIVSLKGGASVTYDAYSRNIKALEHSKADRWRQ